MIVLDTNIVIALLNGDARIAGRLDALSPGEVALSFVTAGELFFGARHSRRREENLVRIRRFLETVRVIHSAPAHTELFGELKHRSLGKKLFPGDHDLWIAATALQARAVLVTRNTRHFGWIEGLELEDWKT